ncbi:MAG: hypothetical protein HC929_10730 [Leptolyngbyaceae cyanobacterium SM2_5_2]|nr:hypothetical protein [Leptolyngbyaceae cyanobacterium SM2_5_2]
MSWLRQRGYGWLGILAMLGCLVIGGGVSHSSLTLAQPPPLTFSDPTQYPAQQAPSEGYLPVAEWSGRLILPDRAAAEADDMDWVWVEIYTSPNPALVGQRVRLQWQGSPEIRDFLALVTRGIEFDEAANASLQKGIVHPTRLNGWAKVGPLQSLAGTRPQDDMIVALPSVILQPSGQEPVLKIDASPIQIPERFYGLVKVLGPAANQPAPEVCPGRQVCPSDYQQVQHYNPASQAFDGRIETVRIPQVPPAKTGVFQSTPQDLAKSATGQAGWYLYGAKNTEGTFVVWAIARVSCSNSSPKRPF